MKIDAFTPDRDEPPIDATFRMICTVMPQIVAFVDAAYKSTQNERQAAMLRIFYRNFAISTNAAQALIEKLMDRPMKLSEIEKVIEYASTSAELKDARKALGAMRVQDAMFDQEVDDLRAILVAKLEQTEAQERGEVYEQPEA